MTPEGHPKPASRVPFYDATPIFMVLPNPFLKGRGCVDIPEAIRLAGVSWYTSLDNFDLYQ
jgi:hypothetical protein